MSGRISLRLPAQLRPQDPGAQLCTPWFWRDGAARLGSAPALLTFDDADFLERFLAGIDASRGSSGAASGLIDGAFPPLRPLRDWSEPPRATRDADGTSRIAPSLRRATADPRTAEPEDGDDAEAVLLAEEARSGQRWLRKLYPPAHRHFHLACIELVCDHPDQPRVDPARIVACGAVVRRLVLGDTPAWEDWIPAGEGKGFWAEVADGAMTVALDPARPTVRTPLDPAAPRLGPAADTAVRTRLGLGPTDPLPALSVVQLNPLPPAQGAGHTARFGMVPVQSRDVSIPPANLAQTAADLRDEATNNLQADLVGPAATLQTAVRKKWAALLDSLWGAATSSGQWGPKPNPMNFGAERDAIVALVASPPFPETAPPSGFADGATARRSLIDAMMEEATSPHPTPTSPAEVPRASWDSGTCVVTRWVDGLGLASWATTTLRSGANRAAVASYLRQLLLDLLTGLLGTPLSPPVTVAERLRYDTLAAVLLWVRNLRIQLERTIRDAIAAIVGPGDGLPAEARAIWDPHDAGVLVPLFTVASTAAEIEAYVVADEQRATLPRPWPALGIDLAPTSVAIAVHRAALLLETQLAEIVRLGGGGGVGFDAVRAQRVGDVRGALSTWRALGLDLDAQPEQGLVGLDALHFSGVAGPLATATAAWYDDTTANADETATEIRGRETQVVPRYDPDHVYIIHAYAKVRDAADRRCVADRVLWSAPTEPFTIADHMDLLGLKPAPMRMPDLGQLMRDLPRVARARALPFAPVTTPPDSGYTTGETPADTARSWGIAWICSIGIPVFTICAWILFSIILSILLMIPGFAWMLLLKICIPGPVPRRA